jgi:hypothetical protein
MRSCFQGETALKQAQIKEGIYRMRFEDIDTRYESKALTIEGVAERLGMTVQVIVI